MPSIVALTRCYPDDDALYVGLAEPTKVFPKLGDDE
jgi:hypothetical protein